MFSIGEFSRITRLTVKAIRLYHEKGILVPEEIDHESGYRYYGRASIDRARVITLLKGMDFPLETIKEILEKYSEDSEVISFLEEQRAAIEEKVRRYNNIITSMDSIIILEKESQMATANSNFDIEMKEVKDILVAGIRYKGRYDECGKMMGKIGKHLGRYICGKPMNLYHDMEYKEEGADIETCLPVRKGQPVEGISIRHLTGGKCASLIHKGSYDSLSRSYERLMSYVKEQSCSTTGPIREIYLRGPGMIFRGNPNNYLTEIQIFIKE